MLTGISVCGISLKKLTSSKLTACFFLAIIIVLVSCQKEDCISPEDILLRNKIIGTWESTDYYYKKICFKNDNTFIDSSLFIYSARPGQIQIDEVITGNYSVRDAQLFLSGIKMAFSKTQFSPTVEIYKSVYEPLYNLTLEGENLIIEPKVHLVSNLKSNSNIVGSWSSDKLIAVYDRTLPNKFTEGLIKYIYNFESDLHVDCLQKVYYKNNVESKTETADYIFSNSKLSIYHWGFYANVTFTKNEMFWTFQARNYKKQQ